MALKVIDRAELISDHKITFEVIYFDDPTLTVYKILAKLQVDRFEVTSGYILNFLIRKFEPSGLVQDSI